MAIYRVKKGECVSSIAFELGFLPKTIWNDPSNFQLKQKRKDPNILFPGDELNIPEKEIAEYSRPTDNLHQFRVAGTSTICRLQVFDGEQPRANQKYTLVVEGRRFSGVTDWQGKLEHPIRPDAQKGSLTIGPDQMSYDLQFGYLDPVTEVSGLQGRLNNLGYYSGEMTGEMNEDTRIALRAFQCRFQLQETGELDAVTIAKLEGIHDRVSPFPGQPSGTSETN
jgi:Putative peptidoglycan binding domain/LysM domain